MIHMISILMGVYNAEESLEQCIDSVLNQSYENFEFIICDDASTDNSYELLKNIEKADSRIKLLKNTTNQGLASTLNYCLSHASGEYIARMDADDVNDLSRLEREMLFLEQNPYYAFVGTQCYKFDEQGVWGELVYPETPQKKNLLWNTTYAHPTIIMKKDTLLAVGGYRVAPETERCEDYDLWLRLLSKNFIGYNMPDYLYYYFEGRTSFSKFSYKYRVNEAKVRFQNFKNLGWLPEGILFVIKPLIIGLIPRKIMMEITLKRFKQK